MKRAFFNASILLAAVFALSVYLAGTADAVVLDNGKVASLKQGSPQYAPGEVIIKLKQKEPADKLYSQSYSTRRAADTGTLSAIK